MSIEDLMQGVEELDAAREGYDQAQQMYDGDVPEVFTSSRIRAMLAATGIDFELNFAKTPVDAVVDRLEISAITTADDEGNKTLSRVWRDNQLDLEIPDLHRKACSLGDAYMIVLDHEDDAGNVTGVDIYYNSPLTVRAIYSDENPREIAFVIKRWCEMATLGKVQRVELYYNDRTERWTTKPGAKGTQAADWVPWPVAPAEGEPQDEDSWSLPHDYGRPPVFHFRTDRPYGTPEHRGGYGPQNAINKLAITHMSTVDSQGFPLRYGLTEAATTDTSDFDPAGEDFDDVETGPSDTGDESSLKAGPGEFLLLRGFKGVGQFDPADPSVFLEPIMFYVRAMAQITVTPMYMFDTQTGQEISGESRRQKDAQFVKKVDHRRRLFQSEHRVMQTFILGRLGIEDATVDVRWAPAATVEDKVGWETTALKIANGVPRRQALLEAGYREEQVDEWLSGVDEAELSRRVEVLARFADSAQKLSAATALGVVTPAQVQELLAGTASDIELLGDIGGEPEAADA